MEINKSLKDGMQKVLENLKEPIQNLPESPKPSELSNEERIKKLISWIPNILRSSIGIPPKFINMEFKGTLTLDLVQKGVCLTGKAGTGKTMAICLLVRDWLIGKAKNTHGVYWGEATKNLWEFISYPEFVMSIQDSFKNNSQEESAYQQLQNTANKRFLIIDDLGAEKPTEFIRQSTYYLINQREMYQRPTFITTNFSLDHIDKNIDPRISSRIAGMCDIIRMDGPDLRIKRK